MNIDKTKVMSSVAVDPTPVLVGNPVLEVVDTYIYVEQSVQFVRRFFELCQ